MSAVEELVNIVRDGFNSLEDYRTGSNKQSSSQICMKVCHRSQLVS